LTVNYAKYAYDRYRFRCNAFTCAGTTTSDSALLRVLCPGGLPTVVTDPSSVTTTVGTPKRIDVTGTNIVSAQWQVSDGNGGVFRNILPTDTTYTIGATTATNANITIKYPKRTQYGFAYRVILSNTCGDTKASAGTSLIVNFPLAVNELDAKVRIYPNPTNDVINIDLPITNFKVTLSDSKGSVMLRTENKNQISIKELPTGLYFLNVKTADGETTKKVVKN
jgi:predicted carbohydrate-binding protein with CBM5 and CBM33 domain